MVTQKTLALQTIKLSSLIQIAYYLRNVTGRHIRMCEKGANIKHAPDKITMGGGINESYNDVPHDN